MGRGEYLSSWRDFLRAAQKELVSGHPLPPPALRPASNRVVCRLCHFPTMYDDPSALDLPGAFQELSVWKSGKKATLGKGPDARPFRGPWCLDRLESLSFLEPCRLLRNSCVLSVLLTLG